MTPDFADLQRAQLDLALRRSGLFNDLDEEFQRGVQQGLEMVRLSSGETLLRQGEPGDCLYIVVSGRVRVTVTREGRVHTLTELGPGQAVGEMALLTTQPRTATVRTIRDTQLAKLSRATFECLVERYPLQIMRSFTRMVVTRLRGQLDGKHERMHSFSTVAVIPAGPDVRLSSFCARLTSALEPFGHAEHLTAERIDRELDSPGISQTDGAGEDDSRLVGWLSGRELTSRYCVYEADRQPTAWTARCRRQADHILIVGRATSSPDVGAVEASLTSMGHRYDARRSLVLLHEDRLARPRRTARWLEMRDVERHHHLRMWLQADFDRLARVLTGHAVALVLGGGGARGYAHLGVIRAIRELGLPIDAVGGSSIGALFAALVAQEMEVDEMLRRTAGGGWSFFDLTVPVVSLASSRRFASTLSTIVGDADLEDLWLPFFCVSTNLSRAAVNVHSRGPLATALLASNSLPAIYPPVVHDGDLLVDGGVLNNIPVDVMASQFEDGAIVAVDVSPAVDLRVGADYGVGLSGLRALWSRLSPFATPIDAPGILATILRTSEVASIASRTPIAEALAALYLRPPVERFGVTDHRLAVQIAEVGYVYARERVARWRADHLMSGVVDPP